MCFIWSCKVGINIERCVCFLIIAEPWTPVISQLSNTSCLASPMFSVEHFTAIRPKMGKLRRKGDVCMWWQFPEGSEVGSSLFCPLLYMNSKSSPAERIPGCSQGFASGTSCPLWLGSLWTALAHKAPVKNNPAAGSSCLKCLKLLLCNWCFRRKCFRSSFENGFYHLYLETSAREVLVVAEVISGYFWWSLVKK